MWTLENKTNEYNKTKRLTDIEGRGEGQDIVSVLRGSNYYV